MGAQLASGMEVGDVVGGLEFVTSTTFSAQATVSINSCFGATFDNYLAIIRITGSTGAALNIRLRVSGTDASAGNYYGQYLLASGAIVSSARATSATSAPTGAMRSDGPITQEIIFADPAKAAQTGMLSREQDTDTGIALRFDANRLNDTTAYDGFTLYPDSGTMTGTVTVFGYRRA